MRARTIALGAAGGALALAVLLLALGQEGPALLAVIAGFAAFSLLLLMERR
jgi:hypothetical protein